MTVSPGSSPSANVAATEAEMHFNCKLDEYRARRLESKRRGRPPVLVNLRALGCRQFNRWEKYMYFDAGSRCGGLGCGCTIGNDDYFLMQRIKCGLCLLQASTPDHESLAHAHGGQPEDRFVGRVSSTFDPRR